MDKDDNIALKINTKILQNFDRIYRKDFECFEKAFKNGKDDFERAKIRENL